MCGIIKERIRINKILAHTIGLRLANTPADLQELTQLCVIALEIYYDGACPEECIEAKARSFALWHLARSSYETRPPSRAVRPLQKPDPRLLSSLTLF